MNDLHLAAFEKWWDDHGKFCRAGGGDYERTFAYRAYEAAMEAARAREEALAAQLRECAETLGADQIDEHRAMRAYADSVALLAEMSHISRTSVRNAPLKEQT